jgi:LacI family transcriptional regulator
VAVTVRDIARAAQVSAGTVSRVLNGHENVDPQLTDRVRRAVEELGYQHATARRGGHARPHRSSTTEIGFLLTVPHVSETELMSPFWAQILHGAETEAKRHNAHITYRSLVREDLRPGRLRRLVAGLRLDVVLLVGPAHADVVQVLAQAVPVLVLVDHAAPGLAVDAVVSDGVEGARTAVEHLIAAGHRDIAWIGGPLEPGGVRSAVYSIEARATGYRNALAYAGIPVRPELLESAGLTPPTAFDATRRLLASRAPFTAIYCANDNTALGAMLALQEAGFVVPRDVSIAGFDDDRTVHTQPALTTVRVHKQAIGTEATRRAMQRLADPRLPVVTAVIPVELVPRASVAPPGERTSAYLVGESAEPPPSART